MLALLLCLFDVNNTKLLYIFQVCVALGLLLHTLHV